MIQKIKGKGMSLIRFLIHTKERNRIFRMASGNPMSLPVINQLAAELHPACQRFRIIEVRDESADTRSYRLKSISALVPAFFRAGQYLSFSLEIEGSTVRRPFSISSSPDKTREGELEICVRRTDSGFVSRYIYENWKIDDEVESSGPAGEFYFHPLREAETLLFFGGGSGITPFRSLVSDILEHYPDRKMILFHGAEEPDQFLFLSEFQEIEKNNPELFHYVPVCSGNQPDWLGETGFFTLPLIEKKLYAFIPGESLQEASFFICGPPAMERHLKEFLKPLNISRKQIRSENFAYGKLVDEDLEVYLCLVHMNDQTRKIECRSNETLLIALERAGLRPPSLCRSGSCGWCRSRLISGHLERAEGGSGLRLADRKFSFVHPCSEYPRSDLEIYIPDEPVYQKGDNL